MMMMMGSTGEQMSDVKKSRYELLWDATRLTSHGVLIAVSEDEFMNSFPQLTHREQEKLYYIYTRAVAKLQEDIMLEFKLQCEAWEVKEVLEEMEMLVHQQEQDGGLSFRSAPMADAVRELTIKIKQEEMEKLRLLVEQSDCACSLKLQQIRLPTGGRAHCTAQTPKSSFAGTSFSAPHSFSGHACQGSQRTGGAFSNSHPQCMTPKVLFFSFPELLWTGGAVVPDKQFSMSYSYAWLPSLRCPQLH